MPPILALSDPSLTPLTQLTLSHRRPHGKQAETSNVMVPERYLSESTPAMPDGTPSRDWALCRWLALEGGVIAIPASPFFSSENKALGANYIRFAFCKSDETLRLAGDRMEALVSRSRVDC